MLTKLQGKKVVGAKQTIKTIKSGQAAIVYIAEDAEAKVTAPVIEVAKQHNVEIVFVETMKKLGALCGIDVGAATACILKEL
ncbi:Ribosome-associated protein L7Ae-like protein [Caloramator mitchellensis]|uniref:Ribosome-associated protein L7Ae-like protein n=1 Tax=Caloramator mitchellensis TaxID=908809 RepID=A0A0R3JSB5_CALMK|nr:ribosomal L7Ae/L30e/S12e/Gadd45 family protein [Caloramator mitchellensis]KRQ85882.1 Ribosome-associated protein L7Ae-like protein [Caloramator mitchellensis]